MSEQTNNINKLVLVPGFVLSFFLKTQNKISFACLQVGPDLLFSSKSHADAEHKTWECLSKVCIDVFNPFAYLNSHNRL